MAATGSVTLTATATGLVTGSVTFGPVTISLGGAVGETLPTTLSSGNNTISVPTGTTFIVIAPPSTNVQTITLKGNNADTGIPLSLTSPSVIAINPSFAGSTFVLTAGGATTATIWFF